MLHALPITNVRLRPCPVGAEQLTPVAGGHYCTSCQRVVHDFTQASALELTEAQAAAPDGRLCGRFRQSQLAPAGRPAPPRLRPRLRQFLLAAVLILVQGLSAHQAWAQVQPRVPLRAAAAAPYQLPGAMPLPTAGAAAHPAAAEPVFSGFVEQMPQPPGGVEGLVAFLRKEMRYPEDARRRGVAGKVFVRFTVARTGQIVAPKVVRSLDPALDAEALRVIGLLPPWTPGRQNNQPIDFEYTLPISFTLVDGPPAKQSGSTD